MSNLKVMTVELCDRRSFTCTAASAWETYALGATMKGIGPSIEGIRIHAFGENFSPSFEYEVVGEYSYDGETWTAMTTSFTGAYNVPANKVFGDISSSVNEYGLYIRFKVKVRGTTAGNSGTLSLTAAIRFAT